MALAGEGVLGLWFDVAPDKRDDFFDWHNREHIPERVGTAGFRSGRRFGAVRAPREFFVLYETERPESVSGPDYLHNVQFGSEWSKKQDLLNTHRAIFQVLFSLSSGHGGSVLCLRYNVDEGREEEQRKLLAHRLLPKLIDEPGISGCHLSRIDARAMHASANQGVQNKFNKPEHIGPEWMILIEGGMGADSLERVARASITDDKLISAGAQAQIESGLYQMEYGLFRIA